MNNTIINLEPFVAYTLGIIVYLAGMRINQHVGFLRRYNIPEPVTGGILASLFTLLLLVTMGIELKFDLQIRDILLVYFFTTIGINARISDLISGGKPLIFLLALTVVFIFFQNIVGIVSAMAIGQPKAVGILVGSASLIGGHGTTIAWAPDIAANYGVPNALEIGIAAATLGLVVASLLGGPIANFLIKRNSLSGPTGQEAIVGISHKDSEGAQIDHINIMRVILATHVAIILGYILNDAISRAGFKLPLFVSCLIVAILLSNTIPKVLPRLQWPARTKALAVVSDFSLGLFIAMSLMGMQLWSIANLAGPLIILLLFQALFAVLFIYFILFRVMGRDYLAAVLSAGFAGFALGATPTAIANMTAVTKSNGPAPIAFIILPLVGAFFVDLTNAFAIKFFLDF